MAKDDFKNAAAKLLAQHSAKTKKQTAPMPSITRSEAAPVVTAPVPSQPEQRITLVDVPEWEDAYPQREQHSWVKLYILAGLALFGCAVMVFLVPETIFGIAGNAVVGIVTGAGLGLIINREF